MLFFSKQLGEENLTKDLISISIRSLMNAKLKNLMVFPSLMPKGSNKISNPLKINLKPSKNYQFSFQERTRVDAWGVKTIEGCFEKYSDLGLDDYDKKITQEFKNNVEPDDVKKRQMDFLANVILDSLKTDTIWDEKLENDKELEVLFKRRISIEKELILLEDIIFDRFQEKKNEKPVSSGIMGGLTTHELLTISKGKTQNNKDRSKLLNELETINSKIKLLEPRRNELNNIVYRNPLVVDSTGLLEKGKIKKSFLMEESIKLLKNQKTNGSSTIGGDEFVEQFKKTFRNKDKYDQNYESKVLENITFFLENNNDSLKKLSNLAKEEVADKVTEIDESIEDICDSDGERLHHFKPLVNRAKLQNLSLAKENGQDITSLKKIYEQTHCDLINQKPYSESNLGVYAGIGAGMLATGVLAPVGIGVVLATGGIAFATVGAYETYEAYNNLTLTRGLANVDLVSKERARKDLSNYRAAVGWTIADGVLFPLDAIVVGGKVSKSLARLNVSEGKMISKPNKLETKKTPLSKELEELRVQWGEDSPKVDSLINLIRSEKPDASDAEVLVEFEKVTRMCRLK